MNVVTVFLNGDPSEDVFTKPLQGTDLEPSYVLKLRKSSYGLKQASKCWNEMKKLNRWDLYNQNFMSVFI